MEHYHGYRTLAWRAFDACLRRFWPSPNVEAQTFASKGLHFGQIDPNFADRLRELVCNAQVEILRREDNTPGFKTFKFDHETLQNMNRYSNFRRFNARETWILADLLDALKDDVAACLGTPWSVLKLNAWTSMPSADEYAMYCWHEDGFVSEIFKLMVYLVPLTPETGGFEFRIDSQDIMHRAEQAGSWVLFENSDISHRGVAGSIRERVSIEITLARSGSFDLRPRFPGQNAHWPEYPWIGALDGCTDRIAQLIAHGSMQNSRMKKPRLHISSKDRR